MKTLRVIALAVLSYSAGEAARAGDDPPNAPAVSAEGCYVRIYDSEHLARHAGQKTVAAQASFAHNELRLALAGASATSYVSASCDWRTQAGRDVKDKPLLPAFKGKEAYDCIVTYSEESAEEGGYLIFAPTPDARSATVYLDSPVAARTTPQGKARSTELGLEDRVFKLTRAPVATCKEFAR